MEKLRFMGARILRLVRPYRVSLIFLGALLWRLARPGRWNSVARDYDSPKRILVVRLDAIGDLIMTSFIFRELKNRFPESTITAVVQQQNKAILETNPYVDRIVSPQRVHKSIFFPGFRQDLSMLKLYLAHLRGEVAEITVNPRLDGDLYSGDVLLKLVDSARIFKYEETAKKGIASRINKLAFNRAVSLPRPLPRHEVLNNMTITERVTGVACTSRPEIFFTDQDLAYSEQLFEQIPSDTTIICIAFGAQAMRRVWPIERWAETIRLLSDKQLVFPLIVCTNSEGAAANRLQSMLTTPSQLLKGATLRQVAACIQSCDLFIGPDSGLAHLAAAVGCPSVIVSPHPMSGSLDHGNSPLRFGPYSDRAKIVQPQDGLAPCVTGCDAIAPHCILQVLPSQVAEACSALLDEQEYAGSRYQAGRESRVYSVKDVAV